MLVMTVFLLCLGAYLAGWALAWVIFSLRWAAGRAQAAERDQFRYTQRADAVKQAYEEGRYDMARELSKGERN